MLRILYVKGRNLEIKMMGRFHNFQFFCRDHISLRIVFVYRKIHWARRDILLNRRSVEARTRRGTCLLQDT
jgi:hypothetical protein